MDVFSTIIAVVELIETVHKVVVGVIAIRDVPVCTGLLYLHSTVFDLIQFRQPYYAVIPNPFLPYGGFSLLSQGLPPIAQ